MHGAVRVNSNTVITVHDCLLYLRKKYFSYRRPSRKLVAGKRHCCVLLTIR